MFFNSIFIFPSSCSLIHEQVNTINKLAWLLHKVCSTQLNDVVGPRLFVTCKVSMHSHVFDADVKISRVAEPGPTGVTGDTGITGSTGSTGSTGGTGETCVLRANS